MRPRDTYDSGAARTMGTRGTSARAGVSAAPDRAGPMMPADRHAAMVRVREREATPADMAWLRIISEPADPIPFRCDCQCRCHSALGGAVGRNGRCDKPFRLDEFDCERACRASHVLAGECSLDEGRAP